VAASPYSNPLLLWQVKPTAQVGIVGIGLGHMALKFAQAWGCGYYVLQQPGQRGCARVGADNFITPAPQAHQGGNSFDFILSAVNAVDYAYIAALRPKGIFTWWAGDPADIFPLSALARNSLQSDGSPAAMRLC
jgi:D-arabinose 1-dehydrogenase-like Zn-dependent alcohol dehydrogenase